MPKKNKLPRIMFAGTESGAGKTTLVAALLRYWTLRKLRVQPFKVGPDYIDPGFHTAASMRVCHNLDSWLLSKKRIQSLFCRHSHGADLAVIEGMMGLFDGFSPMTNRGSSAEIAQWLQCPVILILPAGKMARSAAAVVKGFQKLDPEMNIAGVILNEVGSQGHYDLLKKGIEKECRIPCLGYVARNEKYHLPEQPLGLVPVDAAEGKIKEWFDGISETIPKNIECERLLQIANKAPQFKAPRRSCFFESPASSKHRTCRIAYAKDEAFHFYYPENVELLQALGGEMVAFSPLYENQLPEDIDLLYLGGGFPENFAKALAKNKLMRQSIRREVEKGLPVYAECGGLMYLCQSLIDSKGEIHKMVGILPGQVIMTTQLQNFGYTFLQALSDNLLFKKGEKGKGHEFHYSYWKPASKKRKPAYQIKKTAKGKLSFEGIALPHLLASYVHIHFLTRPRVAKRLISQAARYRKSK